MRRLLLFVILLMGLLLVACGGSVAEEATVPPSTADEAATAVSTESGPVNPNRRYAVPDLTLVANTGRPQFLNSFANW